MGIKESYILRLAKGKDVLDIGSGGDIVYAGKNTPIESLLAYKLKKVASSLTLVEIDRKAASLLRNKGFNVITGDAQNVSIKKKYDIIVLGDVIEHIDNVGMFIDNMKRHLKRKGKLIVTTPNPFSVVHFFRALTFRKPRVQYDHVNFISESNFFEICRKHNLKIVKNFYFTDIEKRSTSLFVKSAIHHYTGKIWKYLNQSQLFVVKKVINNRRKKK